MFAASKFKMYLTNRPVSLPEEAYILNQELVSLGRGLATAKIALMSVTIGVI